MASRSPGAGHRSEGRLPVAAFPLIYGFRELIAGNGFVAGVEVNGRVLVKDEGEEWWAYGVEPGGVAAPGPGGPEAYQAFRQAFHEVLVDSAVLTEDFGAFKAEVEALCARNEGWEAEWLEAREAIRAGRHVPEGPFSELPRRTAEAACSVTVVKLDDDRERPVTPSDNAATADLATAA